MRRNITISVCFQALEIRFEVKFEKIKVNLDQISIEKEESFDSKKQVVNVKVINLYYQLYFELACKYIIVNR